MLIDGEKYACEACVRGHRVSNCQHADRPLQHINKKGRPVSQCQHCRSMRKSRSAHVKCDCGEKTSKCAHLQPTIEGHRETCCCNHGGRCSCSIKKETALDTVPESDSEGESQAASAASRQKLAARRRRANTIHADGASYSQPKSASKQSRAAQKGNPYMLNRANSANSAGSSSDGLMHKSGGPRESASSRSRGTASGGRRVKSETTSPLMSGGYSHMHSTVPPPLDLSIGGSSFFPNGNTLEMFTPGFPDSDAPMFSAGLNPTPIDWASYDTSDKQSDTFSPSSYSQTRAPSYNGMFDFSSGSDHLPNLANTTSTSGDVSEVEEYDGFGAGNMFVNRGGMMPNAADFSNIGFDSFFKGGEATATVSGVSMVEDDPAFWMPNYNDGVGATDDNNDLWAPIQ